MKITIDNTLKTIEIDQDANLKSLIDFLKELNIKWEEYKIVATKTVWQYYPIQPSVPYYPVDPLPNPYTSPWVITCSL